MAMLKFEVEKKPMSKKDYILLSFLLSLIIQIVGLIILQITPFGTNTIAVSDAENYLNGLAYFGRLITGREDFLYSFKTGMGNNEWSSLAWGGFNPVTIIAAFVKLETIPNCLTWVTIISLAVSAVTMYVFLSETYKDGVGSLIFSVSYSLIGFSVVNCYQTGFFTGVHMLPLMVLGLTRLEKEESPLLYIVSLGYCITFNFYFGFQLCVASVVFFVAYMLEHNGELVNRRKRLIITYSISSLISGLLGAFIWLPTLKAYSGGGRLNQTTSSEFTFNENMPFLQIFSKLFTGANSTSELVNGLPNIFCGILVVALCIHFFLNHRIEKKHRITMAGISIFYLLSFYIVAFTLLMHGGTHTNWFNYRYSYAFSFILIWIAAEDFQYVSEFKTDEIKKTLVILVISTILVFSMRYEFIKGGEVLLDLIILAGMVVLYHLSKKYPQKLTKQVTSILLVLLVSGNLLANYTISTDKVMEWSADLELYQYDILFYKEPIKAITETDESFFRMENEYSRTDTCACDSLLYDYNSIGGSGPTIRAFVNEELSKFGINWFNMRHYYSEGVPAATDALLGLKYVLSARDLAEEKDYIKLSDIYEDISHVYQSPYALQISILADEEAKTVEPGNNIFNNLNEIWKSMTGGKDNIFTEENNVSFTLHNSIEEQTVTSEQLRTRRSVSTSMSEAGETPEESSSSYISYEFEATEDGPVYYYDTSIPDSSNGSIDPAVHYVGNYKKGDIVTGKILLENYSIEVADSFMSKCSDYVFAYSNNAVLEAYADQLNARDITIAKETDSRLNGTFTAEEGQIILFTIPWDEGWTCYIDGEKAEIQKTWNLFMSVDAPEGEHTYEMRFFPAWMNYGIIISSVSLAALVAYVILWKKNNRKLVPVLEENEKAEQEGLSDQYKVEVEEKETGCGAEEIKTDSKKS